MGKLMDDKMSTWQTQHSDIIGIDVQKWGMQSMHNMRLMSCGENNEKKTVSSVKKKKKAHIEKTCLFIRSWISCNERNSNVDCN